MTHEEIEAYLKSRDLDAMQYQLAMDAMCYAENAIIEKARRWLSLNMTDVAYFGMNGNLYKPEFIQNFIKAMEE